MIESIYSDSRIPPINVIKVQLADLEREYQNKMAMLDKAQQEIAEKDKVIDDLVAENGLLHKLLEEKEHDCEVLRKQLQTILADEYIGITRPYIAALVNKSTNEACGAFKIPPQKYQRFQHCTWHMNLDGIREKAVGLSPKDQQ